MHTTTNPRKYVTFVDPTPANGVFYFARIAHELGRLRPDIPLLVVEGEGTEETLAACGIELIENENVFIMERPVDVRSCLDVTSILLVTATASAPDGSFLQKAIDLNVHLIFPKIKLPDDGRVNDPRGKLLVAELTELSIETCGADTIRQWVLTIINLWDDRNTGCSVSLTSGQSSNRVFKHSAANDPIADSVILVPHLNGVDWECDLALCELEKAGIKVVRSGGSSGIDCARNRLASEALHDGAANIFFIDADIGFDPADAVRLLTRPEPVISGVYAKKGRRQFASEFSEGTRKVIFGKRAASPYPLKYAAAGFLRIKSAVLWRMIEVLRLPCCNRTWGRGEWPFFQPTIVTREDGEHHYLGEDWAFSHRLGQIGIVPMADTSIRLWHYGRYPFGWEEAGKSTERFANFNFTFE